MFYWNSMLDIDVDYFHKKIHQLLLQSRTIDFNENEQHQSVTSSNLRSSNLTW